ncbi:hypothetical protein T484DRAFT_2407106 [Baffinella frigidus]|nr:hypothetical protein T484DRAFT_2407106 [Cryptophyta sp. CCMP2293]
MDPVQMRPHGFNCFQAFFADVNNVSGAWKASGRDGQKSGCKINGASFVGRRVRVLWKDEKMHNGTICHYMPPSNRGDPRIQRHTVRWDDTGKEDTHDWTDLHDWHLLEDELSVNILPYEIKGIKTENLAGMDNLWGAAVMSHDDVVASKAAMMTLDIARHMPEHFQDTILEKIFGTQGSPGALQQAAAEGEGGTLRVRRCLQLVQVLLKGQLRICDNLFSFTQVTQLRAHGYSGRGKAMTIQLHVKEDAYKAQTRAVKVHSRQALDEVMTSNFPHLGADAARFTVTLNGHPLVRGSSTTLEELGVKHGADLKLEYDKPQPQPTTGSGSIADTIAGDPHYYSVFFKMMEDPNIPSDIRSLVWEMLMALPTLGEELRRTRRHIGPWQEVFQGSMWHSLYILQIVDSLLLPHSLSSKADADAAAFHQNFLANGGMPAVARQMDDLHQMLSAASTDQAAADHMAMLRAVGLPVVIRVMRLCAAPDMQERPSPAGERGRGELERLQLGNAWGVVGRVTELVILLGATELLAPTTDAMVSSPQPPTNEP